MARANITHFSTIPDLQKYYSDSPSPYGPDLAPCDFFLFPKMKLRLKGRRFDTTEEINAETQDVIDTLTFENFQGCMKSWKTRWGRCVHPQGDLLWRRRWKLGVTVRNFFMVKFPEFLVSPTYICQFPPQISHPQQYLSYLFCFLDRAFSIMKTKNKPTKCTN